MAFSPKDSDSQSLYYFYYRLDSSASSSVPSLDSDNLVSENVHSSGLKESFSQSSACLAGMKPWVGAPAPHELGVVGAGL